MFKINNKEIKIAIIGLGYVGLPLSIEFNKKYRVIGFDLNETRINELKNGLDRTNEVSEKQLHDSKNILFTCDSNLISEANVYIITVPTPVDDNNQPDLGPIRSASTLVGENIKKNNIVIYESTVFPGCTEEVCVPILERVSKLTYNRDFFCGYSPERINPGDKERTITKITKITSGSDPKSAKIIDRLYGSIIPAGTYKAPSIAVAEAAKVIENTQRDVNIALINELALIFDKLGIDTREVLDAASTKWNFLSFHPGLVGGHCIGVDPYYLTHKALALGYEPEMILAGRRINDNMGNFIGRKAVEYLKKMNVEFSRAKIGILGLTFKENCPDLRNTKVHSIIEYLEKFKCELFIADHWADKVEAKTQFGINLVDFDKISDMDILILAVAHDKYQNLSFHQLQRMLKENSFFMDLKSLYETTIFSKTNIKHWRL